VKPATDRAPMALTLGIWFCTIPFVLALLGPWLGLKSALLVALSFAAITGVMCWILCLTSGGGSHAGKGGLSWG